MHGKPARLLTMGLLWAMVPASTKVGAQDSVSGQDPLKVFLGPQAKASVPLEEILRGGPSVDGIPALADPKKLNADEAGGIIAPNDPVLGISLNGEAAAYPVSLLNWHEIVNDKVGGIPIAVTYCPLCRSGIVFDRRQGDQTVAFGVSGLLYNSDLVMYDRQTKSLWSQILGESIAGPSTGKTLRRIPAVHMTWEKWKQGHPKTTTVSFDTGYERDYRRNPYGSYESSREIYFPVGRQDSRLHPKEPVFGVRLGSKAVAIPEKLVREKRSVAAKVGTEDIAFKYEEGVRAFRKDGSEVPGFIAYWFAWFAFHPDTQLVAAAP